MKTGLIIGIYFALVCCREKIQPAVVQADLSEAVYTDTTWFADCEIVFPETTDRSLISMINKIVLTPERIFLFDIQDKKILLFTRRGKFITDIRPHGRGPGEWLGITDFTVDETDREIIVTADRPYKFLYYDYNGNFLREKTSEAFYTEITRTTKNSFSIHLPGGIPLPRELFIKERTPVFHSKRRLHHLQLGQQPYKTCGYRGFREI